MHSKTIQNIYMYILIEQIDKVAEIIFLKQDL